MGGHYYAKNRALIVVVDAMDEARVGEARLELARLLFEDGMRGSRLLVRVGMEQGAHGTA